MKPQDRARLETALRTLLANIAYALATGAEPPNVGVALRSASRRRTRYDRRDLTNLPTVLGVVSQPDLLTLRKSRRKGYASTITPAPSLRDAFARFRFEPDHFAYAEGQEVICLTRTERDYVEDRRHREWIDYADTPETTEYRREVERINAMLATADVRVEQDGWPTVLTSLRHLRRYFSLLPDSPLGTQRFDLGGRLFGGWWQDLPKARRGAIRIAGEPIADLDFASMFLRLAYLHADLAPPGGDLYAVPGLSEPRWRPGVKRVSLAMLFRRTRLRRLSGELRALLPDGVSAAKVRGAILSAHPDLAPVFETGIGLHLMFVESRILITALLALADAGVPALPMHDGLMVAASRADLAAGVMQEAAEAVTGFRLPVKITANLKA